MQAFVAILLTRKGARVILTLHEITKRYGEMYALKDFNAEFTEGLYGILGPNGAGKTTLSNIIVGLISQSSGSLAYNGIGLSKILPDYLEKIGYLPQQPGYYRNYTAEEFLHYIAVIKGISKREITSRIDEVLSTVNLQDVRKKKLRTYSGGMIRRLGIAQAIINNPEILILDEPTAGLDPIERIRFRNLITQLAENRIVLLATHIVTDVEAISKEVILLNKGVKVAQASALELMGKIEGCIWETQAAGESDINSLSQKYDIGNITKRDDHYLLRIVSEEKPTESSIPQSPTLEDVYLKYFGRESLLPSSDMRFVKRFRIR